jgi:hypothetical protein
LSIVFSVDACAKELVEIEDLQVKHEVILVEKLDFLDFEVKLLKASIEFGEQVVLAHLAQHLGVVCNDSLKHGLVGKLKAISQFEPFSFSQLSICRARSVKHFGH